MMRPESLRNKRLDVTAEKLLTGITEDGLRLGVHQCNTAFRVKHDHGVGRGLNNQTELLFGLPALGDVECSATHSDWMTIPVELALTPAGDPSQLSFWEHDPVLSFIVSALAQGVLYSLEHPFTILRMQHVLEALQVELL